MTEICKLTGRQPDINIIHAAWSLPSERWSRAGLAWVASLKDSGYRSGGIFVNLLEETVVSFEVKTTFGPVVTAIDFSGPEEKGGLFIFGALSMDLSTVAYSSLVCGWQDWQEKSFTLDPGEYFFAFDVGVFFLYQVEQFGEITWGEVPTGEEISKQASIRNFKFTPGTAPYRTNIKANYPGGTSIPPLVLTTDDFDLSAGAVTAGAGSFNPVSSKNIAVATGALNLIGRTTLDGKIISGSTQNIGYFWTVDPVKQVRARMVYICFLVTPGFDDLEIPISAISAQVRNATESYLSVVIPNIIAYEDQITARAGAAGEIKIYKGFAYQDGTRNLEEILASNFSHLMVDHGSRNASGTMVGYRQRTYSNGIERTISGISYRNIDGDGKIRLRGNVDLFIRPGDICLYGNDRFTVDLISYYITSRLAYMEVSE